MIASFVLVVNLIGLPGAWEYAGHFKSCDQAFLYMDLHYDNVTESRCLLEEYITLPEGLETVQRLIGGK